MSAELIPLIVLFLVGACGWVLAWRYAREIERISGRHTGPARLGDASRTLHARFVRAQGTHRIPDDVIEQDFAEDAPVPAAEPITTPMLLRADLPVQRDHAKDDPFTGEIPKLTEERIQEWEAERDRYFGRHARREILAAPGFGVDRCEADVLAAEAAPRFPYDPDYDNCAGEPHGDERVFYKWYGMEQTACPRCWTNMFGADPDPAWTCKVDVLAELPAATGPERVMQ